MLDKTWEGLGRLGSFPQVHTCLVVVMTRLNATHVPAMMRRVIAELPHVREVTFSPVAPVGDARQHLALLAPFAELREPLLDALAVAGAAGLRAHVPSRCGMPLCAMPEGTSRFNDESRNAPGQPADPGKTKPPLCARCEEEPRCTGVWIEQLVAHGETELRPVRSRSGPPEAR